MKQKENPNKDIKIINYETIDSTMDEAKRLIKSNKITNTTCIIAEEQNSGRGTHGRKWVSKKGAGIYMSLIHLAPQDSLFDLTTLYTLSAGVACTEAIQEVLGLQVSLKPVNDLYVELPESYFKDNTNNQQKVSKVKYGKLGGILTESILSQGKISALITGIGININQTHREFDKKTSFAGQEVLAISLEEMLHEDIFDKLNKRELIDKISKKVDHWHRLAFSGDTKTIQETWEKYQISFKQSQQHCSNTIY